MTELLLSIYFSLIAAAVVMYETTPDKAKKEHIRHRAFCILAFPVVPLMTAYKMKNI